MPGGCESYIALDSRSNHPAWCPRLTTLNVHREQRIGQRNLTISTQVNHSSWESVPANFTTSPQPTWLARRRIAISLIGFTSLVMFNVFVLQTIPNNPLTVGQPPVLVALLLIAIGLGLRSWSAGTLDKSRSLTTIGPYSLVRNPLYVGSFLMMIGFCILCRDWLTLAFTAGPMAAVYWSQVRFEETRLAKLFPAQWPDYMRSTPRFFPTRISSRIWAGWSQAEWLRNREYKAIASTVVGLFGVWIWFLLRTTL